ncbi:mucin-5AC isoform X1 [Stomoxys calcitrans]|uniref:mucin-5AC isoform X1 n=1 Tax=Stomoxys calcitrans TaxID=35570 RepID=UPI0027E36390|nr:mucin-5AC isoform X1 [Stomoxys calcitrans]XP_059225400.1 mucin-5AC isoform X1 [Stomoxys calcitrans]
MLPQLTVYAKIIYLLMVVISGALCTVEDYVIMSQCAHNKAIYLAAEGTVSVTDISQTQNITIVGRPDFVNNNFKIALYAKETQRYLCFNDHWKLVGMKELQDTCYFNEAILHGYFVFRSVVDQHRRIGFTQRGRAVGPKKTVNDACYMFTKIPTDQFFHQHNHYSALSTKTPQSEEEHSSGGIGHSGRGSGAGRPNRHRNQHRNEEGGRNQHGKKPKVHGSGGGGGGRKRQRLQQMRGGGHSSGGGGGVEPKNSSRQNLELSQYSSGHYGGHPSHAGRHHSNHSQPQQYHHQLRHHHNDSRRHQHQHEAKQRNNRVHHRARLTSPTTTTTSTTMATTTTPRTTTTTTRTSTRPSRQSLPAMISSTVSSSTTTNSRTTTNHDVLATSVTHKRKGRRRKGHRKHSYHKSGEQSPRHHGSGHSATLPSYDDEEYMTTDYSTWINGELSPALPAVSSLEPTSASLPSWESWYPTATTVTSQVDENLLSSPSSYVNQENSTRMNHHTTKEVAETYYPEYSSSPVSPSPSPSSSSSSYSLPSHYDISKEHMVPLMPLPLPTTALSQATSLEMQASDQDNVAILPAFSTAKTTTTTTTTMSTTHDPKQTKTTNTSLLSSSGHHLLKDAVVEDPLITKLALDLAAEEINVTSYDNEEVENATLPITSLSDEPDIDDSEDDEGSSSGSNSQSWETSGEVSDATMSALSVATPTKSTEPQATNNLMTDYIYATTRTAPITGHHKVSRHRQGVHGPGHNGPRHSHNAMQHHHSGKKEAGSTLHHKLKSLSTARELKTTATTATSTTTSTHKPSDSLQEPSPTDPADYQRDELLLAALKNVHIKHSHNTVSDVEVESVATITSTLAATAASSPSTSLAPSLSSTTTRKALRKSTQRLLATPFHQLTYVRNEAGDIDIDNLDNISMYPDLMDNENAHEEVHRTRPTSRFTMISGYFPASSSTSALPESIRIAKIKINRERKRMLRLRNIGGYNA